MSLFGTIVPARNVNAVDVTLTHIDDAAAVDLAHAFAQMSPWDHYPFTPEALTDYFTTKEAGAPRYGLRLADGPKTIIGVLGLRENWMRGPYVQFLGLTATFQGRSIGEAVLCHIAKTAQQEGAQNVWVMASQFNKRALGFYGRHGFVPVATIDALVTNDTSEVLLRKRLRSSP